MQTEHAVECTARRIGVHGRHAEAALVKVKKGGCCNVRKNAKQRKTEFIVRSMSGSELEVRLARLTQYVTGYARSDVMRPLVAWQR
jgi:hypothetical protein